MSSAPVAAPAPRPPVAPGAAVISPPSEYEVHEATLKRCTDEQGSKIAQADYFASRTTKSVEGAAKPAVTAYSALPNAAIVVGTFVDGFDVNGSVMRRTIAPDR